MGSSIPCVGQWLRSVLLGEVYSSKTQIAKKSVAGPFAHFGPVQALLRFIAVDFGLRM